MGCRCPQIFLPKFGFCYKGKTCNQIKYKVKVFFQRCLLMNYSLLMLSDDRISPVVRLMIIRCTASLESVFDGFVRRSIVLQVVLIPKPLPLIQLLKSCVRRWELNVVRVLNGFRQNPWVPIGLVVPAIDAWQARRQQPS